MQYQIFTKNNNQIQLINANNFNLIKSISLDESKKIQCSKLVIYSTARKTNAYFLIVGDQEGCITLVDL